MNTLPTISRAGYYNSRNRYEDLSRTNLHPTTHYELEFFIEDSGAININGNQYPIHKGMVLLSKPGDIRYSVLPFSCMFIHFTTSDKTTQKMLHSLPPMFSIENPDEFERIFQELNYNFLFMNEYSMLQTSTLLMNLLFICRKNLGDSPKFLNMKDNRLLLLNSAMDFIHKYYQSPISVKNIAEHCSVSSSYLYRIFTETTSTTPNGYLMFTRINASKTLLLSTNMPLSEIALACGFSSQAYFSHCFKQLAGISPKLFQKKSTSEMIDFASHLTEKTPYQTPSARSKQLKDKTAPPAQ